MVKQPACAAAISSSGLVPFSFSKRVLKEIRRLRQHSRIGGKMPSAGATSSAPNRFRLADHLNLRLGLSGRSLAVPLAPASTAVLNKCLLQFKSNSSTSQYYLNDIFVIQR